MVGGVEATLGNFANQSTQSRLVGTDQGRYGRWVDVTTNTTPEGSA